MTATKSLSKFIQRLHRGARLLDEASLTDGELLAAYVVRRDQAAFATLVHRHGPMVLRVCRRILRNDADADDAFQATFLVLIRKARTIRSRAMVSNWLYGVAQNTALKAKALNRRRQAKEREAGALSKGHAAEEVWQQAQALLDEAMSGLADRYRVAIVLCDLEGKTLKEAARQLACPLGTVATRLSRGRAMLAKRLSRHGLTLSAGTVAAVLSEWAASARVSASLLGSTLQAASTIAAGHATTGIVSAKIVVLTEGVLKAMLLTKLKIAGVVLIVLSAFAAGLLTLQTWAAQSPAHAHQVTVDAPQSRDLSRGKAKDFKQAQPKPATELAVIVTAQLYEVDDAFYKRLPKEQRMSTKELDEQERAFLNPPNPNQPEGEPLGKALAKQKLLPCGKELTLEIGNAASALRSESTFSKEGTVLSWNKTTACLPSPDQVRKGQKTPQIVKEGVSLVVQVQISADRRRVRAKFTEKSAELEDIEKVTVQLDNAGKETLAEIPFLKETAYSRVRDIPDNGTYLMPLQYRPRESKRQDRWLIVLVAPRIYIEAEERAIRGEDPR